MRPDPAPAGRPPLRGPALAVQGWEAEGSRGRLRSAMYPCACACRRVAYCTHAALLPPAPQRGLRSCSAVLHLCASAKYRSRQARAVSISSTCIGHQRTRGDGLHAEGPSRAWAAAAPLRKQGCLEARTGVSATLSATPGARASHSTGQGMTAAIGATHLERCFCARDQRLLRNARATAGAIAALQQSGRNGSHSLAVLSCGR